MYDVIVVDRFDWNCTVADVNSSSSGVKLVVEIGIAIYFHVFHASEL